MKQLGLSVQDVEEYRRHVLEADMAASKAALFAPILSGVDLGILAA